MATLAEDTKKSIDISNFPEEYRTAIEMKPDENHNITIDFGQDPNNYRDLGELIHINPKGLPEGDKEKFLQICKVCPDIQINDDIRLGCSTAEEYRNGEEWITNVLQGLDPEWSNIQKIAFIDNAIGKRISYSPDFDTEVSDPGHSRALWKIIDSGYGVCNGIAQVEQYVLNKAEIDSQVVSSGVHSFLKLNDIEILSADGGKVAGNTILDPTWNLAAHRYGAKPENFFRSYEEIRKHDIKTNGEDSLSHKNDEELRDATLELDEKSLRDIYTSIGVADKDGNFPVKELVDLSKNIDDSISVPEDSLKKQLLLLQKMHPDFAVCQNSTSTILQGVILKNKNLELNKCVVNRVYHRSDQDKRPTLYVYADLLESGKKFYYADKETSEFVELEQKEFAERFECYETDLEKNQGHRPWEISEKEEIIEDLTRGSGKVVAVEGEER